MLSTYSVENGSTVFQMTFWEIGDTGILLLSIVRHFVNVYFLHFELLFNNIPGNSYFNIILFCSPIVTQNYSDHFYEAFLDSITDFYVGLCAFGMYHQFSIFEPLFIYLLVVCFRSIPSSLHIMLTYTRI